MYMLTSKIWVIGSRMQVAYDCLQCYDILDVLFHRMDWC